MNRSILVYTDSQGRSGYVVPLRWSDGNRARAETLASDRKANGEAFPIEKVVRVPRRLV